MRPTSPAPTKRSALPYAIALLAPLLLVACTGSADVNSTGQPKDSSTSPSDGAKDSLAGDGSALASDLGRSADGQQTADGSAGVGTPCPSGTCPEGSGLVCSEGACRAKCTTPTGACGATSNCPSGYRCTPYNGGVFYLCLPGAGLGQPCGDNGPYCADSSRCGSTDQVTYQCLPICTNLNGSCGTGGTCRDFDDKGCLLCTAPF